MYIPILTHYKGVLTRSIILMINLSSIIVETFKNALKTRLNGNLDILLKEKYEH